MAVKLWLTVRFTLFWPPDERAEKESEAKMDNCIYITKYPSDWSNGVINRSITHCIIDRVFVLAPNIGFWAMANPISILPITCMSVSK